MVKGARIINMSFAGPRDPSLDRTLKKAYDKGVVLIAAASARARGWHDRSAAWWRLKQAWATAARN
jgi:hypothetical protein